MFTSVEGLGTDLVRKAAKEAPMNKWQCQVCGYTYDPTLGDPDSGVSAGTAFEDLPQGWVCPQCGALKEQFSRL